MDEREEQILELDEEAASDESDEDVEDQEETPTDHYEKPRKVSRKDKKRKKLLESATQQYGADIIRTLESIRDARERIVYVAEAVFARKGFAGARTQEIADLAGVNKAMIHYYFENKEKLYHAVLDKILFDLIKLTQESIRDNASVQKQLEIFYRGFFDYIATHRNFTRLTAMEMGSGDRYLHRMVETFFKPLFDRGEAFIKKGISDGVFSKKVNPKHFLISVYGMTMSYFADAEFVEVLLGEDPLSDKMLKDRREALLDMVFAGLGCSRT